MHACILVVTRGWWLGKVRRMSVMQEGVHAFVVDIVSENSYYCFRLSIILMSKLTFARSTSFQRVVWYGTSSSSRPRCEVRFSRVCKRAG